MLARESTKEHVSTTNAIIDARLLNEAEDGGPGFDTPLTL
jgi:hypothetical protein